MLKFITVLVICYFGKLENNKSSIFGPATIFWTRDNLPATRDNLPCDTRHAPIRLSRSIYSSLLNTVFVLPTAKKKIPRHSFTESTIQKVYLMPFKVTNEVKIIMFQ